MTQQKKTKFPHDRKAHNQAYSFEDVLQSVAEGHADDQEDNQGQIVFYSGWFRWNDGSIRNYPDPSR